MYHRSSYGYDLGSDLAGGLAAIMIFLCILAVFITVVCTVFVVRTFVKYGKEHMSLWIALAICLVLAVLGGLLATTVSQGFLALPYIGVAVLLVTCLVVDLKNRDTLMRENVNLIDEVLRKPWEWGSETPLQETEQEQIAA